MSIDSDLRDALKDLANGDTIDVRIVIREPSKLQERLDEFGRGTNSIKRQITRDVLTKAMQPLGDYLDGITNPDYNVLGRYALAGLTKEQIEQVGGFDYIETIELVR